MKRKKKKPEMNHEIVKSQFIEVMRTIRPGLEEGKDLFMDGILLLTEEQLEYFSETKGNDGTGLLCLCAIAIQAYPGESAEFANEPEDELLKCINELRVLTDTATMMKMGLLSAESMQACNKLGSNAPMKFDMNPFFKTTGIPKPETTEQFEQLQKYLASKCALS